jgi:hypothetical protein
MISYTYRQATLRAALLPGILTGIMLAGSGCASAYLTSSRSTSNQSDGQGIAYYLPMRYAQLTFERTKTPDLVKAQAAHKAALEELARQQGIKKDSASAKATAETLLATYDARGMPKSSAPYLEAVQKLGNAEDTLKRVGPAIATADGAARKAKADLDAISAAQGSEFLDRFSVSLLPYVADVQHRYVMQTAHLASRSETVNLKTTKSGLLSTVDSEATDQTQEVLVGLAKAFAAGGGRMSMLAKPSNAKDPAVVTRDHLQCETRIERIVDLANQAAVDTFIAAVNSHVCTDSTKPYRMTSRCETCRVYDAVDLVRYSMHELGKADVDPNAAGVDLRSEAQKAQNVRRALFDHDVPEALSSGPGIAYRRELPYFIDVMAKPTNAHVASFVVEIPNGAPVELLPMEVSSFGHVKRKAEFDNGMLVSLDSTTDSELAKAAAVPFEIVKAAFSAVSELVQLKIDIATKDTGLAEQEAKLAEAQMKLDEALEKLEDARKKAEEDENAAPDATKP